MITPWSGGIVRRRRRSTYILIFIFNAANSCVFTIHAHILPYHSKYEGIEIWFRVIIKPFLTSTLNIKLLQLIKEYFYRINISGWLDALEEVNKLTTKTFYFSLKYSSYCFIPDTFFTSCQYNDLCHWHLKI